MVLADKLSLYKRKRNFGITPEPAALREQRPAPRANGAITWRQRHAAMRLLAPTAHEQRGRS